MPFTPKVVDFTKTMSEASIYDWFIDYNREKEGLQFVIGGVNIA